MGENLITNFIQRLSLYESDDVDVTGMEIAAIPPANVEDSDEEGMEKCPLSNVALQPRGFCEYQMDESSGVLVLAWNDNRPVLMLTTIDDLEPMHSVSRWSAKEKKRIQLDQPNTVHAYNQYMGGVDRMDQNINNYRVSIGSKKWWWSCFCFGVDTAVHNAWQLWRKQHPNTPYLDFRRYVATSYLRTHANPPSRPGRKSEIKQYDQLAHWPEVTSGSRFRCAVCDYRTDTRCKKCDVGLHSKCFEKYHVKK